MKKLFTVLLTITILLTTTIVTSTNIVSEAEAAKGQGVSTSKYGSQTKYEVCGDRLCSEIPGGRQAYEEQKSASSPTVTQKRMSGETCNCAGDCTCGADGVCTCTGEAGTCVCGPSCTCGADMYGAHGTCTCGQMPHGKHVGHGMETKSGTMTSDKDPGRGHDSHQLAVLLPPSNDLYKGMMTYSASENIQLVVLHGPLAAGEDKGQPTWTPDGETTFAMTLVDPKNNAGSWMFTGNALAVHTKNLTPFTVSYSVHYAKISNNFGMSGACYCPADCNCDEDGVCTCSGEPGACMCGPNCTCSADGTCQCSPGCSCDKDGNCTCPGNVEGMCMCGSNCNCGADGTCQCGMHGADGTCQCGMHGADGTCQCGMHGADGTCQCGMHGADGTCQCGMHGADGTCQCGMHGADGTCSCGHMSHGKSYGHSMKAVTGTMTSDKDPGRGHDSHQLALLLPPRDQEYSGLLTYSASENIQLVVLHGPLAAGEDKGQPTWTPDGETTFAMTLVDPKNNAGSWMFTGNALAVHTKNPTPFTVSYSIATMGGSDSMKDGTCQCLGNCTCDEDGMCNCIGVDGPCTCGPHCNCG